MSNLDINQIHELIQRGHVLWKRHALERILERGLTRAIILNVLLNGELVEDYSDDRPFPGGLFLGWNEKQPLHVIVTLEVQENIVAVITAYEPTTDHFEPDFRTRRKL